MKFVITGRTTVVRFMYISILLSMTSLQFMNLMVTTSTVSTRSVSTATSRANTVEPQTTASIVDVESPSLRQKFDALLSSESDGIPKRLKVINGMRPYIKEVVDTSDTPSIPDTATNTRDSPPRKWAYAFLMAGVDSQKPAYRGILYNILVAAEILKESQADILVMIQMSRNTKSTGLPPNEERWLRDMKVKIEYLEIPPAQNFYQIQFEKFRILQHTEYSRIMYMDGDVMPYCVMDYLFELSDPQDSSKAPLLKKNVVLSWTSEPAHGGLFLLSPEEGDYDNIQKIIEQREEEAMKGTELFDERKGWGHAITPPDHWHSLGGKEGKAGSTEWHFHGDFADQGLLYYYTKYFKQNVSIVYKNDVENWTSRNGEAVLEQTMKDALVPYACLPLRDARRGRYAKSRFAPALVPYRDFRHFSGRGKPWQAKRLDLEKTKNFRDVEKTDAVHFWYYILRKVDNQLGMNLDLAKLNVPNSIFGAYPTRSHVHQKVMAQQRAAEKGENN